MSSLKLTGYKVVENFLSAFFLPILSLNGRFKCMSRSGSFLESLFLLTVFFLSNINTNNAGVRVGYYMCMGM
jgi:preprotein translocase subunit SecG